MERIDKIIASQGKYSRSEVKTLISKKRVTVNGEVIKSSSIKADPNTACIVVNGEELSFKKFVYLMLNKPKGYVSATEDKNDKTVLDLVPLEYRHRNLFPAGRLDTTGLMIITDDGEFAHNILSPKKHISKTYNVTIDIDMSNDMVLGFKEGVNLSDGECKSASLEITGKNTGIVILTEGRYHQIKRMFGCFGAKVVELERIKMGNFSLPSDLKMGEVREFSSLELEEVVK